MGVKKNCYIFIYKQLKGYRGTVLNILISSILVTFLGMNWPLVYRYIINSVFYNGSLSELKFIFLVYILLFFSEKTLQYIWKLSEAVIASDFVFKLRKMLYQKIFTLNMSDKERYSSGEILDIINNDVQQVYTFLVDEGVFAITCFVRLIMAMIYIYYINKYASFFILFLTIINYLISKYLRDRFMIYFREYKKRLENYNIFLLDVLSGLKDIKLYSATAFFSKIFMERTERLFQLQEKQFFEDAYKDIFSMGLNVFSEMLLYIAAAFSIISGNMLLGDFISLMIYYSWVKMFFAVFVKLFSGASKSRLSLERINNLMNNISEDLDGVTVQMGDIVAKDVSFAYNENKVILKNVNLHIGKNEIVALSGYSGSGKTTFIKLLLKFYKIKNGCITINGVDINNISSKDLRKKIGFVSQNSKLMEGTIRSNLLFGNEKVSDDKIWDVLKLVRMDEYIKTLPQKLDTIISAVEKFSTGQSQRLLLARVLLRNSDIIILDEATSNIDFETEKSFMEDFRNIVKNKTVIIIAYRLLSLQIADRVYFLENGSIVDEGKHKDLINRCEGYRKLVLGKD